MVQVFPVAIGRYADFPDLDVEEQVGRVVDLLAPFGGWYNAWAAPATERGADAVQQRLLEWANSADAPQGSVLYWVGHGWSDGMRVGLAHSGSPAAVGAAGVTPDQLADAIRRRLGQARTRSSSEDGGGWALIVVDACHSRRFVQLVDVALKTYRPPSADGPGVVLIGVSGEGTTTLGRFTDALRQVLATAYRAGYRIPLTDLGNELSRLLDHCQVSYFGDLADAVLVRAGRPRPHPGQ